MQLGLPGRDYYLKTSSARDLKAYHRYMVLIVISHVTYLLPFFVTHYMKPHVDEAKDLKKKRKKKKNPLTS